MRILILGVNGFIGGTLAERIIETTDWLIDGLDLDSHKIGAIIHNPRLNFFKGDIRASSSWIEAHIQKADAVLPLVAIANPSIYVKQPLRVFELDFEANLEVIKLCVKHKKRIIFPSTSEVYGLCADPEFDEETSPLVLGPIEKQRWIYSCAKQMLDRVIYAYGFEQDLSYTIFRPFNFVGAKMDDITNVKSGSSRAVPQFISNVLHGKPIQLVGGGEQRRCFTDIDDAIDALMLIIKNQDNCAHQRIFNIGNPANNFSMRQVAEKVIKAFHEHPAYRNFADAARIEDIDAESYFGKGYADTNHRVPGIAKAKAGLGWEPTVDLDTSLAKILETHLKKAA